MALRLVEKSLKEGQEIWPPVLPINWDTLSKDVSLTDDFNGCHKRFTKILRINLVMNFLSSSHIGCLHLNLSKPQGFSKPQGEIAFRMNITCCHHCVFSSRHPVQINKIISDINVCLFLSSLCSALQSMCFLSCCVGTLREFHSDSWTWHAPYRSHGWQNLCDS